MNQHLTKYTIGASILISILTGCLKEPTRIEINGTDKTTTSSIIYSQGDEHEQSTSPPRGDNIVTTVSPSTPPEKITYPEPDLPPGLLNSTSSSVATYQGGYPPPEAVQPSATDPMSNLFPPPTEVGTIGTPYASPGGVPESTPTLTAMVTNEASPTVTSTPELLSTALKATDPQSVQFASGKVQLIEFFTFWSPVSKAMAPVMHRLEARYNNRVSFVYLDVDDPANQLFKVLLGDRLPPIFFLVDGEGNVLYQWQGYVALEEFEAQFAQAGVR